MCLRSEEDESETGESTEGAGQSRWARRRLRAHRNRRPCRRLSSARVHSNLRSAPYRPVRDSLLLLIKSHAAPSPIPPSPSASSAARLPPPQLPFLLSLLQQWSTLRLSTQPASSTRPPTHPLSWSSSRSAWAVTSSVRIHPFFSSITGSSPIHLLQSTLWTLSPRRWTTLSGAPHHPLVAAQCRATQNRPSSPSS